MNKAAEGLTSFVAVQVWTYLEEGRPLGVQFLAANVESEDFVARRSPFLNNASLPLQHCATPMQGCHFILEQLGLQLINLLTQLVRVTRLK